MQQKEYLSDNPQIVAASNEIGNGHVAVNFHRKVVSVFVIFVHCEGRILRQQERCKR